MDVAAISHTQRISSTPFFRGFALFRAGGSSARKLVPSPPQKDSMPNPGDARGKGVGNVDFPEEPKFRSRNGRDRDEGREEIFFPDENARADPQLVPSAGGLCLERSEP